MVHASIIGCGNMGSALLEGLSRSGEHTLTACDVDPEALESVADYATRTTTSLETAAEADVIFLVVKPDMVGPILEDLDLSPDQTLVSFAAGVSTAFLEARTDATVVRAMPNLAAATGNVAAAIARPVENGVVTALLDEIGEVIEVEESQMDLATAVNGSGPAFVFYFIQAMKRAAVEGGLEPAAAETLVAQTFKGAAETVLRSGRSVDELIDAVCSPNGTTIEGMEVLWDSDVEETIVGTVKAAETRAEELRGEHEA
jgi:pyrroline-5-carboxylate reductase